MKGLKLIGILATGFILTIASEGLAQQNFILKGKLNNPSLEGEKVTLKYLEGTTNKMDTTRIKGGTFEFKGVVAHALKATLTAKAIETMEKKAGYATSDIQEFYIDGGIIELQGTTLGKATIKGGGTQEDYTRLTEYLSPVVKLEQQARPLARKEGEPVDTTAWPRYQQLMKAYKMQKDSIAIGFFEENPGSYVSLHILQEQASIANLSHHLDKIVSMYALLPAELKKSSVAQEVNRKIEFAQQVAVGQPAIDFSMNDTVGSPISLSSFRGKYVLLDFWASWCIPCRFENPHLVKAYEKFKDKNFTILSVSLDRPNAKQAWLDAIKKDNLPWTHVSDLAFADNLAAKLYGVYSIPMNYLIDPDGIIVASYLRGEALEEKLNELLTGNK